MTRWPVAAALSVTLDLLLAGCASGPEFGNYQSRIIDSSDQAAVLQAGERIMQREFGRVTVQRTDGRIVSAPSEYTASRDTGMAGGLVGLPSTMRRTGTMVVQKQGDVTVARMRIDVERQDSDRRAQLDPTDTYRLTDSPAYTAIDRDAATTRQQNTAWTPLRRDQKLERAILDELRGMFGPVEGAGPATAPADEARDAARPSAVSPVDEPDQSER